MTRHVQCGDPAEGEEGNLDKGWTVANENVTTLASLIVTHVNVKAVTVGGPELGCVGALLYSDFL